MPTRSPLLIKISFSPWISPWHPPQDKFKGHSYHSEWLLSYVSSLADILIR
jgi:hypothetical protein